MSTGEHLLSSSEMRSASLGENVFHLAFSCSCEEKK
jgi:hypothetical protein